MAKRDLLKNQMKRPAIKRTKVADEDRMDEAVQRVTGDQTATPTGQGTAPANDESTPVETSRAPTAGDTKQEKPGKTRTRGRGATPQEERTPAGKQRQAPKPKTASFAAEAQGEEEETKAPVKRMTIDLPQDLHKQLKLLSIREEIYMKDYIIALIQKSLGSRG